MTKIESGMIDFSRIPAQKLKYKNQFSDLSSRFSVIGRALRFVIFLLIFLLLPTADLPGTRYSWFFLGYRGVRFFAGWPRSRAALPQASLCVTACFLPV